jgi:hypothetical protein
MNAEPELEPNDCCHKKVLVGPPIRETNAPRELSPSARAVLPNEYDSNEDDADADDEGFESGPHIETL